MIAEARAHGDLSENAEYHAAKERQAFIEGRVMDLEDKLAPRRCDRRFETVGQDGEVRRHRDARRRGHRRKVKYQIVGDLEADAKKGKISISSPIARALIGKSAGDTVEVSAPGGARSYEILKVQFA